MKKIVLCTVLAAAMSGFAFCSSLYSGKIGRIPEIEAGSTQSGSSQSTAALFASSNDAHSSWLEVAASSADDSSGAEQVAMAVDDEETVLPVFARLPKDAR